MEVARVGVVFPSGVEALCDVTLRLAAGEFVSIVGPSGCGKSTLVRVLARLLAPTCGRLETADAAIGIVFQQPTLLPWRTVLANVALPLELGRARPDDGRRRATAMIERVGLGEFSAAYPLELSGGMRMRVALARALVTAPRLLLLDEPFAALDEITRQHLGEELLALRRAHGFGTLLVTHNVFEAVFLSDRVLVMSRRPGRIVGEIAVPFGRARTPALRATAEFARLAGTVMEHLASDAP